MEKIFDKVVGPWTFYAKASTGGHPIIIECPHWGPEELHKRIFAACGDRLLHELAEKYFVGENRKRIFDPHNGKWVIVAGYNFNARTKLEEEKD